MNNTNAIARAAEAMLRALGGADVKLRCPVAAAKDPQARQLGLEPPITEDIGISPVVVRATGDDFELLIAPSTVAQLIQDRGQTAEQFIASVLAVFIGGREFHVNSFAADHFMASEYLYRIQLKTKS